ncbi:MAG: hypothetical protein AAF577_02525 [Pseudomonadota bacterium]
MSEDEEIGWMTIMGVLGGMGIIVLALFYFPELRPDQVVLDCDRRGGVWSSEMGECRLSDSPPAGLAA